MEDHMETLSLSFKDHSFDSEEDSLANQSSSSSSSFDQDFLGFFSEEWSRHPSYNTTSPENIIFCGKVVSSKQSDSETKSQTSPVFRSTSDSFRYMRFKTASTPRSKSLTNRSPCKSRWQVFMFGFGSPKFPSKMDMSDIKSRQLRQQTTVSQLVIDGGKEKSTVVRRSGEKGWWRLVDVLGCSGGYERDTMVVI